MSAWLAEYSHQEKQRQRNNKYSPDMNINTMYTPDMTSKYDLRWTDTLGSVSTSIVLVVECWLTFLDTVIKVNC